MRAKSFPYTLNPDEIPTRKIFDITPQPGCAARLRYACPDSCWTEHLTAWRREMRHGNETAPEPMPYGHLMFDNPHYYGCVAYGDTSIESKRAAIEADVRGMLSGGWDRDLTKEQLDAIVNTTVQDKLNGVDTGAAPFLACVSCWLD